MIQWGSNGLNSPSLEGVSSRSDDGAAVLKKLGVLPYNAKLEPRARALRKAGNLAEVLLWLELKNGKVNGLNFDRQKVIGNYIVDFYCHNKLLIIEVDGSSHDNKVEYDEERERFLIGLGLNTLHFTDKEIKNNLNSVINRIKSF